MAQVPATRPSRRLGTAVVDRIADGFASGGGSGSEAGRRATARPLLSALADEVSRIHGSVAAHTACHGNDRFPASRNDSVDVLARAATGAARRTASAG